MRFFKIILVFALYFGVGVAHAEVMREDTFNEYHFSEVGDISPTSSMVSGDSFSLNYQAHMPRTARGLSILSQKISNGSPTTIRYPGGAETERYLDPSDNRHFDPEFEKIFVRDLMGRKDRYFRTTYSFFKEAAEYSYSVIVVLPTKRYVSDDGEISPAAARDIFNYALNTITLAEHLGVKIKAFEIGNEWYVHRDDISEQVNFSLEPFEYGVIAGEEIIAVEKAISEAFKGRYETPIIAVQTGPGWDNIDAAKPKIHSIISGIKETKSAIDYVGGIIGHWYLALSDDRETWSYFTNKGGGAGAEAISDYTMAGNGIFAQFDMFEGLLGASHGDLKRDISEWNVNSKYEGILSGANQADPIVSMFHEMIFNGSDFSVFWPPVGESKVSLGGEGGGTFTATSLILSLMKDRLMGSKAVDLNGSGIGGALTLSSSGAKRDYLRVFGFRSAHEDTLIFSSLSGSRQKLDFDYSGYDVKNIRISCVRDVDGRANLIDYSVRSDEYKSINLIFQSREVCIVTLSQQ